MAINLVLPQLGKGSSTFEKKTTVLVKVFKDQLFAEEIRKQTLAEFK